MRLLVGKALWLPRLRGQIVPLTQVVTSSDLVLRGSRFPHGHPGTCGSALMELSRVDWLI